MNINKQIKLNSLITERKQNAKNIDQISKSLPNGNEPVAWRKVVGNVTKHYQYNEIGEGEPLYTHPAKTLTDEEIKAVYGEYFDIENCDWLHLQCIQAILTKAQEK